MCVPGAVCPCQKIIRPLWQPRKLSAKVRALMSSNKRQLQAGGQQDKSILGSSHVLLSGDFCANGQCEVSQFHQSTLAEWEWKSQTTETTNARIGTQFSKSELKVEWYVIMFPKPFFSERI